MDIKILVATHKKYRMPNDQAYIPMHVGREEKESIGYMGDNIGDNISLKNPNYCELTAMYWAWKNLKCDYVGLVHYRRYFSKKPLIYRLFNDKFNCILSSDEIKKLLSDNDIILPKKRNYFVETLYSHYAHTHYAEHLEITREIILELYPEYVDSFDLTMQKRSAHMFNMFIMKKSLSDEYCEWLFDILALLEKRIDINAYDAFQARLYGRVSELLLNVWIEERKLEYKEIPHIHMERINWFDKGLKFLQAKFNSRKLDRSF